MDHREDELVGFHENIDENNSLDNQNNSCCTKTKIFIFISISLLIIAATIIILYFFYFNKKDKENENEVEVEIEDILLKNYTLKAVFYTKYNNTRVRIGINGNEVLEMNYNVTKVYNTGYYTFNNSGDHDVYILLDIEKLDSLDYLFSVTPELKSVRFAKNINSSNIKDMKYMFADCSLLTSVDFSNFNTENVKI